MSKRVVVIASGETERRALPFLIGHLAEGGVVVEDIRIPPSHRAIDAVVAEKLIRSVWFERADDARPDKFVVLLDTDRSTPQEVVAPLREELAKRTKDIDANVLFAYAEQHLEAWYFADANKLRQYLGGNLGKIDSSQPDAIENPKLHLKSLLGSRLYTSLVSRDIAAQLDPATIAQRSPSFRGFVATLKNGN